MKFRAHRQMNFDGLELWAIEESPHSGILRVAESAQFALKEHQQGDWIIPTFTFDANEAQSLMEALWSAGLRPAEGKYPSEHVNALRDHLADMRKLVFKDVT